MNQLVVSDIEPASCPSEHSEQELRSFLEELKHVWKNNIEEQHFLSSVQERIDRSLWKVPRVFETFRQKLLTYIVTHQEKDILSYGMTMEQKRVRNEVARRNNNAEICFYYLGHQFLPAEYWPKTNENGFPIVMKRQARPEGYLPVDEETLLTLDLQAQCALRKLTQDIEFMKARGLLLDMRTLDKILFHKEKKRFLVTDADVLFAVGDVVSTGQNYFVAQSVRDRYSLNHPETLIEVTGLRQSEETLQQLIAASVVDDSVV